jgi:type III restriction enzyme
MRLDKLQYQQDAIEAVIEAVGEVRHDENPCANPLLTGTENIDVKMVTGTGKTYVYTRLMHELKQRFGFFKFIILVPSIAIKEGTKMSIRSEEWSRHFRAEFSNQSITLGVVNAGDFDSKKGKRKSIPEPLRSFCDGTRAEANAVQVLLVNDAMLASTSMTRSDYDTTLFGSLSCPIKGLRATRPIVIIDEPHRFNKDNKAWKNIAEGLQSQLIIRFGATFPETKKGVKDYERGKPVYDLNAVRAFNENLVKGVEIVYPALEKKEAKRYKITHIEGKRGITIGGKEIGLDESLSVVDAKFERLRLENDGGKLKLSNGLVVEAGMELVPDLFTMDYQSLLLSQALDAHFRKERENFNRRSRIKTNSLFFIDSIASFRGENKWLREKFEELLAAKLSKEIVGATGEYREFLEASLRNLSNCSAGYFAEDNAKKGDEAIRAEVDAILCDKEQSLTFNNANGEWNVRRFFFSKWTLCEGWDNPNVFVITKLRSSGSEIRKLQEVGRGLRLPFDEHGKRISNETFYLTYIIDYSEREFARKLLGEINADGGALQSGKITEYLLELLVTAGYADTIAKAKGMLLLNDIIDDKDIILDTDKLFALLPENSGVKVKAGKILGEDLPAQPKVRLNKENFEKLRTLWDQVTKRYLLQFERVGEVELRRIIIEVLATDEVFVASSIEIKTQRTTQGDGTVELVTDGYHSASSQSGVIPYGAFLERLGRQTNLPVGLLHNAVVEARHGKQTCADLFNIDSLPQITKAFERKFEEVFAQKFSYHALDFTARTSIFEADSRDFRTEMAQGDVGANEAKDIARPKDNYLYDKYLYDSDIEHEVLKVSTPAEVVVYGKLPRRSIKLPTYTGGTTSPDFVYAIRGKNSDEIALHFIVETKSDNPRVSDKIALDAQKKVFAAIGGNIKWDVKTNGADFERDLRRLAEQKAPTEAGA